ncbi:MAG: hypothetical protein IRY99_05770 [Isosphaeraceae bacterium]|nr:hypothetical protein [Isosphaeraceae bacterium]
MAVRLRGGRARETFGLYATLGVRALLLIDLLGTDGGRPRIEVGHPDAGQRWVV